MEKEKPNNQNKLCRGGKEGYIIVPNYFLREWVKVLGIGPALLYLQLLSYCHKEKDIAWPSITTLTNKLGISKNSLLSYRKILLKYGLIKKIVKRRNIRGNYQSNFYKVTPIRSPKNRPGQVQKLDTGSPKIALGQVQNLHPNNNNLNITNITTTNRENAVVDFKKLKEKGDLSACGHAQEDAQAEEKMLAVKEQLRDLDFKEEFIEQLLKDYPARKIEKKLDLLLIKRNIQNPAGWLRTALKNDYRDAEQKRYDEEPVRKESLLSTENKKILSREEALQQIQLAKDRLDAIIPSYQIKRRWQKKKGEDICQN